jgi:hypothetical protein
VRPKPVRGSGSLAIPKLGHGAEKAQCEIIFTCYLCQAFFMCFDQLER